MTQPTPLVEIAGTGRFLPDRVVTNDEMARMVDTSDEWIRERTGIRERRLGGDDLLAAHMGAASARRAMESAGVEPGEVDILIVSTATPDRLLPSTACDIQALIGATSAVAFDIQAACSGWLYALSVAEGYIASGRGEVALVVAAEKMSNIIDWTDRTTCVLFGDGSGAAVLKKATGDRGILSSHHGSDGSLAELLYRPAGGVRQPMTAAGVDRRDHLMKMSGREIFKSAVRSMCEAAEQSLRKANLTADQVDLLIPHQANIRIIESTARYAGIPRERVYVNIDRYGNMSSASIPVALDEGVEEGRITPGSTLLLVAFGAGLTWAGMTIRW